MCSFSSSFSLCFFAFLLYQIHYTLPFGMVDNTINASLRMYRFTANVDYHQTVENLKVKLSLKKQVWSGVSNSVDAHHNSIAAAAASSATTTADGNYQPLSWGISVVNKKKPFKLDANEELFA